MHARMNAVKSAGLARTFLLGCVALGFGGAAHASDDIVLHAKSATAASGAWSLVADAGAAGGARLANPDAGAAKLATALAAPANYVELRFTPAAGRAYRLWIRAKAQNDSWTNDSVYVQFSGSQTASGSAQYRIGTTSAVMYSLEESSGAGVSGWGWQDNGYGAGVLGEVLYFDGTPQTIRVQSREDGISIDQIVLSPVTYASRAPGAAKNDTTILAETTTTSAPAPAPASGSSGNAIVWTTLVKATATGGTLKKTGTCGDCYDAGAVGQQAIGSGAGLSFSVATGHKLAAGLGRDTSASTSHAIDYSFKFSGGSVWEVRERGLYKKEGAFTSGDTFRVAVDGTVVKYYRNGSLVYTSGTAVTGTLYADASISTIGGTVTNATVTGTSSTSSTPSAPSTPSPSTPSSTSTLRVLQWNLHHSVGTDNVYDTNRIATWVARMNPDVVLFNEIEKNTYWGHEDQPEVYKSLLQQKTGRTWYYVFAQEYGDWSANGKGNLIFSRFPINISDRYELVRNADRSIALATVTVNGREIGLISTHLDPYDQSLRLAQATEVVNWSAVQPANRIVAGDMNAWPDQTSIAKFNETYTDSWTAALAKGTATAFSGNTGETKKGRIDYIFVSKTAPDLSVVSSQVIDTRDANGVMPSDHRPVLTTFSVR